MLPKLSPYFSSVARRRCSPHHPRHHVSRKQSMLGRITVSIDQGLHDSVWNYLVTSHYSQITAHRPHFCPSSVDLRKNCTVGKQTIFLSGSILAGSVSILVSRCFALLTLFPLQILFPSLQCSDHHLSSGIAQHQYCPGRSFHNLARDHIYM